MTEFPEDGFPVEQVDPALIEKALANLRNMFRGNGLKPDRIAIESFRGQTLNYEAYGIYKIETIISEKRSPGRAGGEIAGSYADAQQRIKAGVEKITLDREIRKIAADLLGKRKDIGFAVENLIINLDRYALKVVIHEPCAPCSHTGKIPCPACQGKGKTFCVKCRGQREIPCHVCHGTQYMNTAQGRKQCVHCHGRGRIRCPLCRQTGFQQCQRCKATGRMPCTACSGTGWTSRSFHVAVKAKSRFIYNRDMLPPDAAAMIDETGPALASENHADIRIMGESRKTEEMNRLSQHNEFIIPYHVRLPWGELQVKIDRETVKATLFGFKPVLHGLPPVLENAIAGPRKLLAAASQGKGNVARQVAAAIRCRLIGEIFLSVLRTPPARAATEMRRRYPAGIRPSVLDGMVAQAQAAVARLTLRPRKQALTGGAAGSFILCALYFLGPLRAQLLSHAALPGPAADAVLLLAAGLGAAAAIQIMTAKALQQSLGLLQKRGGKDTKLAPDPLEALWQGFAAALAAFALAVALSVLRGGGPEWAAGLLR